MQSGVYWGYIGMIEGLLGRIKAEFGGPMKVVATAPRPGVKMTSLPVAGAMFAGVPRGESDTAHSPGEVMDGAVLLVRYT